MRAAGAAGAVPLGLGVYLSFSRGALAALAAGLVVLVVLARDRAQVRAAAIGVVAAAVACAAAAASPAVRAVEGGAREREGAIVLLVLLALMARPRSPPPVAARRPAAPLALPRRAVPRRAWPSPRRSSSSPSPIGGARARAAVRPHLRGDERALRQPRLQPLRVLGRRAGHRRRPPAQGRRVERVRRGLAARPRRISESVHEAHSLELETLAELGLVGLALLALLFAGVGVCAAAVHARDPVLAAGPVAALVVWLAHASIDWDWEMPAVTLIAVVLAGALLGPRRCAGAGVSREAPPALPRRPASRASPCSTRCAARRRSASSSPTPAA